MIPSKQPFKGPSRGQSFQGIDGFSTLLQTAGVSFCGEDLADALWLAEFMGDAEGSNRSPDKNETEDKVGPTVREEFLEAEEPAEEEKRAALSLPAQQRESQGKARKPEGISIKAPAAPALRIRLALARALRPLRRKVPSPGRLVFDEAATVEQIATQQVWSPV
ncbi:MAG: hypothetical protein AAFY15_11135, partial [Cyanobacteria bacterium J06648_11]